MLQISSGVVIGGNPDFSISINMYSIRLNRHTMFLASVDFQLVWIVALTTHNDDDEGQLHRNLRDRLHRFP